MNQLRDAVQLAAYKPVIQLLALLITAELEVCGDASEQPHIIPSSQGDCAKKGFTFRILPRHCLSALADCHERKEAC